MTEEDVEYIGEESNKDPDADKLKKLSELGLLIKKPHSIYPKLNRLFISELEETKYLECSLCFKMFTNSGGHVSKHATKRCKKLKTSTPLLQEFIPVVKLSNDQKKKLCQLEARLAIECGLSFNKVTSEGFNRYTMGIMKFANMKIDGGLINSFPTRNFVKEEACHYSEELIRKYKEEIMERINKAHVALSIDFGLNQRTDYLALFISYIRESEEGWKLMTVPVGLIATTIEKTAQNISTMIGEQLEYFGVDKEQCKQIKVTGDAASNVKACANDYFGGYIKCSCHFLNTIAKRICEPYALLKEELGEDALGHLKNFESFLSRATSFITIIKNSHKISSKLNLFLRQPVSTRWCTKLHVLEDLLKAIPTLFEKITDLTREMANELIFFHGNKDILEQMIELLKPFEIFIVEFETTKSITLHKVAPALFYLKNYMEDKKISYELSANEKFVCFCKSALLSIDYHIKESLSMEHYKASFLCPGTKKMKKIPEIMRRKTVEHIRNLLKVRKPASPKEPTTKRFNIEMDSSDDEDEKDEISLYLADTSVPYYHLLEDGLQSPAPEKPAGEKPPTRALAIFCTIWVLILVGVLLYVVKDQGNREAASIRAVCTSDVQKLEEMIISKNQEIETLQMKISELEGLELTPTPTRLVVTEEGKDEERAKLEEEAKKGNSQWPLEKEDEEEKNQNGEYPDEPAME